MLAPGRLIVSLLCLTLAAIVGGLLFYWNTSLCHVIWWTDDVIASTRDVTQAQEKRDALNKTSTMTQQYTNGTGLIFLGGDKTEGVRLMQKVLDAHPYIRCEENTRLVSQVLEPRMGININQLTSRMEVESLENAGLLSSGVLDGAVREFILQIIVRQGDNAPALCHADRDIVNFAMYLSHLFPEAKFILVSTQTSSKLQAVKQCWALGEDVCTIVDEEELRQHPQNSLSTVSHSFNVLHFNEDLPRFSAWLQDASRIIEELRQE